MADEFKKLDGFGIGGYRSFGEIQWLAPLGTVNLIAGPNNAGKSNVLRFIVDHLWDAGRAAVGNGTFKQSEVDRCTLGSEATVGLCIAASKMRTILAGMNVPHDLQDAIVDSISESNVVRVAVRLRDNMMLEGDVQIADAWSGRLENKKIRDHAWRQLHSGVQSRFRSAIPGTEVHRRVLDGIARIVCDEAAGNLPARSVALIEAMREIAVGDSRGTNDAGEKNRCNGRDLADRLHYMQAPDTTDQESRDRLLAIQDFLKDLLRDREAEMQVQANKRAINIFYQGHWRPLGSLGTGVQQVILLAAEVTSRQGQLICIEEPELHLHPELQRRFIRHLLERDDNQYVIATHSASILDVPGATVHRATMVDGATTTMLVRRPSERFWICEELGFRASDVVQANCVIWVEGPTDAIYIRRWLQLADPQLVDGVHFSFLFYGGSLASHVSALQDDDVEELITMQRINQNSFIVCDSDRRKAGAHLKKRVKRLVAEVGEERSWVTKGREIENYLDIEKLEDVVNDLLGERGSCVSLKRGQFDKILEGDALAKKKVVIAQRMSERIDERDLDRYDLRKRIRDVARVIRRANGMPGIERG